MTDEKIIQALRCTSTPGSLHEDCTGCPYYRKEQLDAELKEKLGVDTWPSCDVNKVGMDAADIIEHLTAENAVLREKQLNQLWKPVFAGNPERKGCYLVTVNHWLDGTPVVREAFWNGADWLSCERRHEITPRVTNWMPLPEAPEEGEKA